MDVFKGEKDHSKMEFRTREEAKGPVFKQFYEANVFLKAINNLPAKIVGLERIERYDYPLEAIREALLNALIHRDYSFSGSTLIKVYDDCIDFIWLGGLIAGLEEKDLFEGISQPRNKQLANIFLRLHYVEAYGTGLRKIRSSYNDSELKPTVSLSPNVFVITLPNRNYMQKLVSELKPQHREIMEFIKSNEHITNVEIQALFKIKKAQAYRILKEMKELELIKEGLSRGEYIINKT